MHKFHNHDATIPNKTCEIFCQTEWLDICLKLIKQNSNYDYILYSGGSDCTIEYEYNKTFAVKVNTIPNNIITWYAQNCNILHEKIELVPIGYNPNNKDILQSIKPIKNKKDDIYFNFSSWSNKIRKRLNSKNLNKKLPAKEYFEDMNQYKYVACPRGIGIDTFRIWEAIHLGCIPILEKSNFSKLVSEKYKILEVNSFKDL